MLIIDSYAVAVGLCLITMLCWGSWANTLKLAGKDWPFPLYYWDYSIGLVLTSAVLGLTLGSMGAEGRGFLADLAQADGAMLRSAFIGGVVFNIANLLVVAAIDVDIDISHYSVGHLRVTLTSPDGTTVTLKQTSDNLTDDLRGNWPKSLVVDIAGDASILMNIQEMSTIAQHRLPVKVFILAGQSHMVGQGIIGPEGTPGFPGQDFVDPAKDLTSGYAAVISVEPDPDNSPAPFVLKPLMDPNIDDVGAMVLQPMHYNSASIPSGSASEITKTASPVQRLPASSVVVRTWRAKP